VLGQRPWVQQNVEPRQTWVWRAVILNILEFSYALSLNGHESSKLSDSTTR
jgi:hypothetical protein